MSSYEIVLPDTFPFDLSEVQGLQHVPADRLKEFEQAINNEVAEKLEAAGVTDEDDVAQLPLQSWSNLRNALLGINIRMAPDGEITHE